MESRDSTDPQEQVPRRNYIRALRPHADSPSKSRTQKPKPSSVVEESPQVPTSPLQPLDALNRDRFQSMVLSGKRFA